MKAHFDWPINGLAVNARTGDLAILDGQTLKAMQPAGLVTTIAGNRRRQQQVGPTNWNGEYLDTMTGEALNVYVQGDREVEIARDARGRIFEAWRGLRSLAVDAAEF